MIGLAAAAMLAMASHDDVTIPGPQGPLAGTMIAAKPGSPVVVIIPGSGPTDRDGNSPLGITAAPYRLLAEGLSARGVSSLRIDKRGMFGSKAAVADANAATLPDYAADARGWATFAAKRAGVKCAWLVGHSEGGLVALQAAQSPEGLCGVILISAPGRPLIEVMRAQFAANPANAPIMADATRMLDAVAAGGTVDPATLAEPLPRMFPLTVQRYLGALGRYDPAKLAAKAKVPVVVIQGTRDIQVSVADAKLIAAAAPGAKLTLVDGVNHVLKSVTTDDRGANAATYADPSLPIAPGVVDAVVGAVGPAS